MIGRKPALDEAWLDESEPAEATIATAVQADQHVPIERARKILGELADAARHHGTSTVLTRHGKPVARIVPLALPAPLVDADNTDPDGAAS